MLPVTLFFGFDELFMQRTFSINNNYLNMFDVDKYKLKSLLRANNHLLASDLK